MREQQNILKQKQGRTEKIVNNIISAIKLPNPQHIFLRYLLMKQWTEHKQKVSKVILSVRIVFSDKSQKLKKYTRT
jgi:hypothetical protein